MASRKTATTDDFANVIEQILDEYGEEVNDRMGEVVDKLAKTAAKQLRSTSPVDDGAPRSGAYAKGWSVEKSGKSHRQLTYTATVYNKEPGLPHLLEHGHALRQGGRSPANPHIKKVEDAVYKSFRPEDLA